MHHDTSTQILLSLYFNDIPQIPFLTAQEEIDLTRKAQKGDSMARKKILEANLRFVISKVKKYRDQTRHLDFSDLIQEGNIGFLHAIDKFDPDAGFRLTTFALFWIRQSVEKAIADTDRTIRSPRHQVEAYFSYAKKRRVLLRTMTSKLTTEQVFDKLGITQKERVIIEDVQRTEQSIDTPLSADRTTTFHDILSHTTDLLNRIDLEKVYTAIISILQKSTSPNSIKRLVVAHRYELLGHKRLPRSEICDLYDITQSKYDRYLREFRNRIMTTKRISDVLHNL